jgi:hypothetical protein
MTTLTEGDVPVDSFYWIDGCRFKRIGVSSVAKVTDVGETIKAYELDPAIVIERIEESKQSALK